MLSAVPRESAHTDSHTSVIHEVLSTRLVDATQHKHDENLPSVESSVQKLSLRLYRASDDDTETAEALDASRYSPFSVSQ